ncbi:hypothetical protein D3C81_1682780 [compost metagenome]
MQLLVSEAIGTYTGSRSRLTMSSPPSIVISHESPCGSHHTSYVPVAVGVAVKRAAGCAAALAAAAPPNRGPVPVL